MKTKPWPHPHHRLVVVLATLLNVIALAVGLLSQYIKWFETRDVYMPVETLNILDKEVWCYRFPTTLERFGVSYCSRTKEQNKEACGWRFLVSYVMFAGCGLNSLIIPILLVFWLLAIIKKHVLTILLKVSIGLTFLSVYVKCVAAFMAVSNMYEANKSFIVGSGVLGAPMTSNLYDLSNDMLRISTLPVGLMFISAFLEVLSLTAMKVSVDVGVKGEYTHLERLQMEAELQAKFEAERKEILSSGERRQSSYHPDSREEHASILRKASTHTPSVNMGTSQRNSKTVSVHSNVTAITGTGSTAPGSKTVNN